MNESAVLGSAEPTLETAATPAPIFNCPDCSQWLPPGSLACPACNAIVYSQHLRSIAERASAAENAGQWTAARDLWREALAWLPEGTTQYKSINERVERLHSQSMAAQQAAHAGREQAQASREQWTRRLGPFAKPIRGLARLAPLGYFLLKFKFLFSFLGFFAFYWGLFGPWFGAGLAVSVLLHEMGHYVAAKRRGLRVDLPVFLPGLGAYVQWYSQGISLEDLSSIALAGPFAGLMSSVGFALAATLTTGKPHDLFSALTFFSAALNLLNLTPIFGLDGAQASLALDRTQRGLILATSLIFCALFHSLLFLPIALGMLWPLFRGREPQQASTRTLVRFVLLLFSLGIVMLRFPYTGPPLTR